MCSNRNRHSKGYELFILTRVLFFFNYSYEAALISVSILTSSAIIIKTKVILSLWNRYLFAEVSYLLYDIWYDCFRGPIHYFAF